MKGRTNIGARMANNGNDLNEFLSPRLHWQVHACPLPAIRHIADFRGRMTQGLVAHFRALPPDAAKLVKTSKLLCVDPGLDDVELVKQLLIAHMFSMRSELMELRVWTAVCSELSFYNRKRTNYVRELQKRHPPDHRCPPAKPRSQTSPVLDLKAPDSDADSSGDCCVTTAYFSSATPAESSLFSDAVMYPSSRLVRRRSRRPSLG
ncbi:hypothetical protein C8R47DRAFT_1090082 [Mycena vitilis]|nr:hypothetical protein C8R47DRAFT_1090082 [Mycena vitilis]